MFNRTGKYLLTSAARKQGISPPVFDDSIEYSKMTNDFPEGWGNSFSIIVLENDNREVFTRERRIIANESLRISNIKDDYFSHVATKYEKENTRRKWCRAVYRFINLVGDLALREIKVTSAYRFADEQVHLNPKVSTSSVVHYHTGISLMLKYCVRKGYIEINPFDAVKDKRDYGHSKKPWLPYERSELELIFQTTGNQGNVYCSQSWQQLG
ncbi:MAG: phage integrase SAM-like domain-containing protein [Amylibacter sp.]|nr:phage integrase SAM-like domain-containing protein [Amylibacter sp.]